MGKVLRAHAAALVGLVSGLGVLSTATSASAGENNCGFTDGATDDDLSVISHATSSDGNPQFNIWRNNQDIFNGFYGKERGNQMFAVPCNSADPGTYWVAVPSDNSQPLRLPVNEDSNVTYCTGPAPGRQPGIVNGNACILGIQWNYFERRLQANTNVSIVIHGHYPEFPNGVLTDTIDVIGLTSVEVVSGFANQFNDGSDPTLQLDDVNVYVADVTTGTTYLFAYIPKGTSYDFTNYTYQRFSSVTFSGAHGGPIALSNLMVDMVWLSD